MSVITDATIRRVGYGVIVVTAALTVTAIVAYAATRLTDEAVQNSLLLPVFAVVLVASVRAAPRNGAVWALIAAAFFAALGECAGAVTNARTGLTPAEIEGGAVTFAPAALDLLTAVAVNLVLWTWIPGVFLLTVHLVILFPAGRARSVRWRWMIRVSTVAIVAMSLATAVAVAPWVTTPYNQIYAGQFGAGGPWSLWQLWLLLASALAAVDLIRRYRSSAGEERLQYRWVTWALGLNVVTVLAFVPLDRLGILWLVSTAATAAIPLAFGIAITKYRLFDVDVVISRTLVFVGLAALITAVYTVVVVGVGSVIGGSSLWLSITATALVALAFEPARSRLQRWVNRLVYGQRATPYEVLSDLTSRLAATEREEGLLDRMAQRLAAGTGAARATVWTVDDDGFRAVACEPASEAPTGVVGDRARLPGVALPIEHDGDLLGALSIEKRRGEALTPVETRLLDDLASSAGLVMRRLRLDAALDLKARELAESRRRMVDAQDVERRRLERELNEGPQQRIAALTGDLAQAARTAEREGADAVATLLAQLVADARDATDQIRALAHGIYPPLLEGEGLAGAIAALAGQTPGDVTAQVAIARRYPLAMEAAVYFCVSEALTNATKHGALPIHITAHDDGDELRFTVSDAGSGFDPAHARRGAGLHNMADRMDALGGRVTVQSTPGHPTTVAGTLPIPVAVPLAAR